MAAKNRTVIELRAGSLAESDVAVGRVSGREGLSHLYAFEVDFLPKNGEPLELADLGGAEALLTLKRSDGGSERYVHGILWAVEMAGVTAGKPHYRARLVPQLERLRHVRRSQVFQDMAVPDIVKEVLDEGKVKHRLSLSASHSKRDYCVQYREPDLDFVLRLLESEGIFFYFEHGTDEHVMVLADAGSGCAQLQGDATVPFRAREETGDLAEHEHLYRLERVHRVATGKVALRDFDFERPALSVTAEAKDANDKLGLEDYEYPGGFRDPGAGSRLAKLRLEELRVGVESFEGEGTCLRFAPGATFEVAEHPEAAFDKKLLLVRVDHVATQQRGVGARDAIEQTYHNAFEALDESLPYRPARRTRCPRACAETATVVGPSGEEIYTEKHGSVKVQFHWDREGKKNEKSSCWVRPAQDWAGPAWGASFVPRIGQEVLVRFLEGDPDQPLVEGAVYDGGNPPPIQLPGEKTKSTLKTASSPGSGGSNELRFEDQKDSEEIFLHAQKDENIEVRNDKGQKVGHDEALEVAKDRSIEVHANQRLRVGKDDAAEVGANQKLTVAGNRSAVVGGDLSEKVAALKSVSVGGSRTVSVASAASDLVGAAAALTVGGGLAVNVGGVLNKAVGGLFSGQVGGARVEVVGKSRDETVGKNSTVRVGGDFEAEVKGQVTISTGKDQKEDVGAKLAAEAKEVAGFLAKSFKLEADKLSVVVGGKLALSVEKSGNVTFGASSFTVDGSTFKTKGSSVKIEASGSAASASASVAELKALEDPKKVVSASFTGADGKPAMAGLAYELKLPEGPPKKGKVGSNGQISASGVKPGKCKLSFPNLSKPPAKG